VSLAIYLGLKFESKKTLVITESLWQGLVNRINRIKEMVNFFWGKLVPAFGLVGFFMMRWLKDGVKNDGGRYKQEQHYQNLNELING